MTPAMFFQLLRVRQWYKNLVVFLALFFSGNLLNGTALGGASLAFLSLSLVSSAGYIINDFHDLARDRLHPEKKHRPLASQRIKIPLALSIAALLLGGGLYLGYRINTPFLFIAVSLFFLTQLYTFFLKNFIFADVVTIATLFVLRAIAGALAITVFISPWLVLVPFFLSLFLSVGKRHSDLLLLREKAGETKSVLREYTLETTTGLMNISTTLLIISYALYSILGEHPLLITTLPPALYCLFRFHYLISSGSAIARNPEKFIKDRPMLIGIAVWMIIATTIIYYFPWI